VFRDQEAALIAVFESRRHGQPVLVADAELPEEEQRAS